uniref:Uncharacterized protein n=1 Tax=Rhizophora mucronata TaxID=61149 RepID=A0A2P2QBV5_RHIMU
MMTTKKARGSCPRNCKSTLIFHHSFQSINKVFIITF